MKKIIKIISLLTLSIFFLSNLSAETATYDDINFPQWSKDLRRTEVITFGSLPFVTLWTTVGYSLAVNGTPGNPLDKSSSNFSPDQQKKIMAIAVSASIGLGLTDLVINLITRKIKSDRQNKVEKTIRVIPYSQQLKDLPPETESLEENLKETSEQTSANEEYFVKGMENAVF